MKFRNPMNGFIEESPVPWLWTLLFGPLYFAVKGIWTHFVVGIILAILTCGISWLIYPLCASEIVRNHYLRKGWREIDKELEAKLENLSKGRGMQCLVSSKEKE